MYDVVHNDDGLLCECLVVTMSTGQVRLHKTVTTTFTGFNLFNRSQS